MVSTELPISIPKIDVRQMEVTLIGDSPLICHRWSEKANDADLLAQAVERAAAELRSFEDRYAEFDAIARAARTAREQIEATATAAA